MSVIVCLRGDVLCWNNISTYHEDTCACTVFVCSQALTTASSWEPVNGPNVLEQSAVHLEILSNMSTVNPNDFVLPLGLNISIWHQTRHHIMYQ